MSGASFKKSILVSAAIMAAGGVSIVASAQTVSSPFANKKKTNAWETPAPAPMQAQPAAPAPQPPTTALPLRGSNLAFEAPAPVYNEVPGYTVTPGSSSTEYIAPARLPEGTAYPEATTSGKVIDNYGGSSYTSTSPLTQSAPQPPATLAGGTTGSPYYPGRADKGAGISAYEAGPQQGYPQTPQYGAQSYPPAARGPIQNQPRGTWRDRLRSGFGDIVTSVSGYLRLGAAATERDGWDADFIADGKISGEASAITQGGLEYGAGLEVRAQYDKYRRGFGGLVGDCPASVPGCSNVDVAGTPTAFRGHTSQFYASGPDNAKEGEIALEGAYLFLRSSYGDVTLGRDDGAAYLFSLGAPTLMAVNASNSPVDFTGLDSVKTVNDASGFAEKVTYVSPRLLGDNIGVGIQIGASYAPNARACGVDYCVRRNGSDGTGVISPDLKDVLEAGIALDRTFDSGLKLEGTATYATASEDSGITAFDDLKAYNFGFEASYDDWRLGASYLDSNNGLQNGDYKAWDVGVTWKPAAWGVSASFGQAIEDNIRVKANQAVIGGTYDFERFTLGAGLQYIERKAPINTAGAITFDKEKAAGVFVQGAVTF